MLALISKRRWLFLTGLVFLVALIWGVSLTSQPSISIEAGVDSQNAVQLANDDSYSVTFKVKGARYLAFVKDEAVFDFAEVSDSGRYIYSNNAEAAEQTVTVFAVQGQMETGDSSENLDTGASVKLTIPGWQSAVSDDESEEEEPVVEETEEEEPEEEVEVVEEQPEEEESQEEPEEAQSQSASQSSSTELKPQINYRTDITFDQLARDPDKYKFENLTLVGKVLQVSEGDSGNVLRVAINGDYDDVVLVTYYASIMKGKRILEDDKVTFSGMSFGTYTYETVLGAEKTIPSVVADVIVDSGKAPDSYGYGL